MKIVTKQMHAYLDYPVAIALFGLPILMGLGTSHGLAMTLSVAAGIAAFILTLLTDHQLGAIRIIPYRWHLAVDFMVGAIFILAPFIFSFEGIDAWYYWLFGATVVIVVSLHKPDANN